VNSLPRHFVHLFSFAPIPPCPAPIFLATAAFNALEMGLQSILRKLHPSGIVPFRFPICVFKSPSLGRTRCLPHRWTYPVPPATRTLRVTSQQSKNHSRRVFLPSKMRALQFNSFPSRTLPYCHLKSCPPPFPPSQDYTP